MAERLVAADASPLIGLAAAGAFDLLRRLFDRVTVTAAVRDEVLAGGTRPGAHELTEAIESGWIEVAPVRPDRERFTDLGAGEASTLALAIEHPGRCLVLMDEPLGRAHARALGIAVTSLAGVLLAAKRAGLVSSVGPYLERLEGSDFRLSDELIRTILEQAGEAPATQSRTVRVALAPQAVSGHHEAAMNGIVDAHHHIWRQHDLPWLMGPMQPRIFGPYEPIRRDYAIEEYLSDIEGSGVAQSIYVQANWAPARAVDEVAWVQAEADRTGYPHAIVGYADLRDPDVDAVLKAQSQYPLLRGIRMQFHWHENELYRFADGPAVMNDAALRRNVGLLADHGLVFELQIFSAQMADGAAFAAAFPDVPMVLAHCGMPEDLTPEGWRAWGEGMERLAAVPSVSVKLSGLGTFIHRVDQAHIERTVRETIDLFGAERCLYGSNFPIEKLWTDYASLIGAYRKALAHLSEADQAQIFAGTARRLYRL